MAGMTQQNSTESTLTPKQVEVIESLAKGLSVTEAARRAGVDRSTIYLWMRDGDDFPAQLMLARRDCADAMKARLRELGDDAIKTIRDVLSDKKISPAVRLKAALAVLQSLGAKKDFADDAGVIEKWRKDSEPFARSLRRRG
jgi:predicted DNA-binding transcriptional regulator AlpA